MADTKLNPYAPQLGERDPKQVIAQTAPRIAELVNILGPAGVERPRAPGKWNARQIVCHLADAEISFAFRLRQTIGEENHVIQPFDQDHWAWAYDKLKIEDAVAAFTAMRNWNLRFLEMVKPEQYAKPVTHPERGAMTFRTLVETMGGHDLNHLRQIEELAASKASA